MQKELFKTPEEQAKAVAEFRELIAHRGWKLLVKYLEIGIESLTKRLVDGETDESLEDVNRNRMKILLHEEFINTPGQMIGKFSTTTPEEVRDDPYYQPEDFNGPKKEEKTDNA